MFKNTHIKGYKVSSKGEVYSEKSNKILSTWVNNRGRVLVTLCIAGKNKHYLTSRLVAYSFGLIDSMDSQLEIDHIDRNPLNNNLENLQALTTEKHLEKTLKEKGQTPIMDKPKFKEFKLKNSNITEEDIEYWVTRYSWTRAAKELGLSDNGLRKRYTLLTNKDPKSLRKKLS